VKRSPQSEDEIVSGRGGHSGANDVVFDRDPGHRASAVQRQVSEQPERGATNFVVRLAADADLVRPQVDDERTVSQIAPLFLPAYAGENARRDLFWRRIARKGMVCSCKDDWRAVTRPADVMEDQNGGTRERLSRWTDGSLGAFQVCAGDDDSVGLSDASAIAVGVNAPAVGFQASA